MTPDLIQRLRRDGFYIVSKFEEITEAETAARKFRTAHGFTDTHGRSV